MLTTAELDQMRADIERTLPDTCQILRVTSTQDEWGRPVETETTAAEVACRIGPQSLNRAEQIIAERLQLVAPLVITMPALTDVRPSDHIEANGRRFNVASNTGERTWEVSKRVLVDEVNQEAV